ncbi:MAG TPA: hypothetical protein VN999_07550 [Thermoanaerobaculia bacterium]|nr:hypothetical protein [Thermoanaerobaculia bacterium]
MSNPPGALNKRDELSGCNPGQDISQPDQRLAADSAIWKVSKTKQVFFHFEIGFKRTSPKVVGPAPGAQAPPIEQAVPQPVLAFPAGAPRPAALALDAAVPPPQPVAGDSGSSTSGGAVYVLLKGGTTVTPPDGWPPPP